jgi:hypothetical protein
MGNYFTTTTETQQRNNILRDSTTIDTYGTLLEMFNKYSNNLSKLENAKKLNHDEMSRLLIDNPEYMKRFNDINSVKSFIEGNLDLFETEDVKNLYIELSCFLKKYYLFEMLKTHSESYNS